MRPPSHPPHPRVDGSGTHGSSADGVARSGAAAQPAMGAVHAANHGFGRQRGTVCLFALMGMGVWVLVRCPGTPLILGIVLSHSSRAVLSADLHGADVTGVFASVSAWGLHGQSVLLVQWVHGVC